jgi:hypothetical protein
VNLRVPVDLHDKVTALATKLNSDVDYVYVAVIGHHFDNWLHLRDLDKLSDAEVKRLEKKIGESDTPVNGSSAPVTNGKRTRGAAA